MSFELFIVVKTRVYQLYFRDLIKSNSFHQNCYALSAHVINSDITSLLFRRLPIDKIAVAKIVYFKFYCVYQVLTSSEYLYNNT